MHENKNNYYLTEFLRIEKGCYKRYQSINISLIYYKFLLHLLHLLINIYFIALLHNGCNVKYRLFTLEKIAMETIFLMISSQMYENETNCCLTECLRIEKTKCTWMY